MKTTMTRLVRAIWTGACVLTLAGCAIGNKHQFANADPALAIQGAQSTAVGVQDRRPYILNHDKAENFVGLQRGGYGNPFDVTTQSGRPLATDIRDTIVAALKKRNIEAKSVTILPATPEADAKQALIATGAERALYLRMDEWKEDTYMNTALHYVLHASVLDKQGTILGESTRGGDENLGGSFWNPPAHADDAVPAAFKRILADLLNDPKIVKALQ